MTLDVTLTNPYAWPAVTRGSEAVMHGLARWLAGQGHRARIVAGRGRARCYQIEGVPVRTVAAPDLTRVHRLLNSEVTMIPALTAYLYRSRPEIVHCFHYCDAISAAGARRPRLLSFQGMPLFPISSRSRAALLRTALRHTELVVCPSQAAADHLAAEFEHPFVVIPNALDTSQFAVPARRRNNVIFCAGTAEDARKRVDILVMAFRELLRRGLDLELWLGGTVRVTTQRELLELLDDKERHRVSFVGNLAGAELARTYCEATVTCLPSVYEAFGVVLVESLASGTPVAGAAHSAIPEIIDSEVGELFSPDGWEPCAEALHRLLERADEASLAEACRARARRYDWDVIGPEFVALYAQL